MYRTIQKGDPLMSKLKGKVALVTGGSRGIGAAIAQRLAAEGADVALTYVQQAARAHEVAAEIRGLGRRALAIAADGVRPEAMAAAVEETVVTLGAIDILVNSAGIFRAAPLEAVTLEDFDHTIAVNVRAAFWAARTAAPHMRNGGRIVSIGSNLGARVPDGALTVYALSKAALTTMTSGLARALGPRGITVNVVHPGPIDTDMNPADGPNAEAQRSRMALPGFGSPEDVASLVAWLASDQARFVTGAALTIDGGSNA